MTPLSYGTTSHCGDILLRYPVNTAVGWESFPGKKAPAMSFLAYYKENKIYQYRELFLLQRHVNK